MTLSDTLGGRRQTSLSIESTGLMTKTSWDSWVAKLKLIFDRHSIAERKKKTQLFRLTREVLILFTCWLIHDLFWCFHRFFSSSHVFFIFLLLNDSPRTVSREIKINWYSDELLSVSEQQPPTTAAAAVVETREKIASIKTTNTDDSFWTQHPHCCVREGGSGVWVAKTYETEEEAWKKRKRKN